MKLDCQLCGSFPWVPLNSSAIIANCKAQAVRFVRIQEPTISKFGVQFRIGLDETLAECLLDEVVVDRRKRFLVEVDQPADRCAVDHDVGWVQIRVHEYTRVANEQVTAFGHPRQGTLDQSSVRAGKSWSVSSSSSGSKEFTRLTYSSSRLRLRPSPSEPRVSMMGNAVSCRG